MVNNRLKRQTGLTLIELILSMVIISIALVGIFLVVNFTVRHSADALVERQALAIAESYMEEIVLQNYSGSVAGSRATFNNVDNYNGLIDVGAHDQQGNPVSGLSQYTITVTVATPAILAGGVNAKQITVSVSGPGVSGLTLVGYRASY
jgi:MSHA pilin protein MshD